MKILIPALTLLLAILTLTVFTTRRDTTTATTAAPEPGDGVLSPVIVELFTSEGCSSCPPADAALAQLQKTQPVSGAEVIALSEHVDYWNYIGWSDPFSSAAFSARQETYAQAFRSERIYTPQMVVDGQTEFVGSSLDKAREAIAKASRSPKADVRIVIPQTKNEKDSQAIRLNASVKNVPPITKGDVAEVILVITEDHLSSNVSRGENSGRKLAHTAVVREMRALGVVDPATKSFDSETTAVIANGWKRDDLRAVVLVQELAHRRVLGAAALRLAAISQPHNR
ncbi:MAG TPA: DUF1223 domain-containing protein [Blastocatellia bacterium]|nr:DUF1223 domain-containing protein [Blastocatellia bacterium]